MWSVLHDVECEKELVFRIKEKECVTRGAEE